MDLLEDADSISKGATYQYIYTIVMIFEGFLFYIFIVHFFSTEIVGAIALLSAILALFQIIFSLGLGTGVQHFISYYLGRKDPDAIGHIIKKMGLVSVLLGIFAFIVTWVSAPLF
ncbi:MAG: MATE family efflux transporter, partial [Conexivisphaera sp.]